MHQVKKLCEPDVIDLSAKKTETTASAAASVGDVTLAAAGADSSSTNSTTADKHSSDTAIQSAAPGLPDGSRQSCTVSPSGSSPRMYACLSGCFTRVIQKVRSLT